MAKSPSKKTPNQPDLNKASKKAASKKATPKKAAPKKAAKMPSWKSWKESRREPRKVIKRIGNTGSITVYVQYKTLSNGTLIEILQHLEVLKDVSINAYYRNTDFQLKKMPAMYITYMATGRSITFKFGGGFLPKVEIVDGNFIVNINEEIAAPLVILYFIYLGLAAYQKWKLSDLDIELKKLELEEKQEEKQERENTKKMEEVNKATENFIEYLNKNSTIARFMINKKSFKPLNKGKK